MKPLKTINAAITDDHKRKKKHPFKIGMSIFITTERN
jgi:hypothetical protein